MDVKQVKSMIGNMGKKLKGFLAKFDDCFSRVQSRRRLRDYIGGQISDLPRKSIEPMALAAGILPRTLQCFLSSASWDEQRMRDRMQWIVAEEHHGENVIGTVDDTGNPKKGKHTAGVQRQWCGNTGKTDNCVVSVHIGCCDGDFQSLLDSDLYMPEVWANDFVRREQAHIPEDVVFRKKTTIALDQIRGAIANGIRVAAWTFDEWYGRDGSFLDGLDEMGQSYVAEVPANFVGWAHEPQMLQRPTPQQARKRGSKRRHPRLAKKALPAGKVKNLVTYSQHFQDQPWQRFKIKDGEKGPVVWEAKHAPFFRKQGPSGLPGKPHTLVVARNVLNPDEIKYFVSDRAVGQDGTSLEWILWVAFSRWPIERCFELAKRDLGMDHFEVRNWQAIHRHLYISQLSLLFCSTVHQEYRKKNDRNYVPDSRASSTGSQRMAQSPDITTIRTNTNIPTSSRTNNLPSTTKSNSPKKPHKTNPTTPAKNRHRSRSFTLVYGS